MPQQVSIHPNSIVEPGAVLGAGVVIGPFCHVGTEAVIGDRVELVSHVSIMGATTLGEGCRVYPMAVLGAPPQNAKHKGGRTTLVVGRNCMIREGVTIHRGTDTSRGETRVGENGSFLAYCHVAHDCVVGNNVTMANVATLGGHCEVGDFAVIGGLSAVHQFCRIGHHAFIGGATGVFGDVIPYGMVVGNRAALRGFNIIGMKRSGMTRAQIHTLRRAYRMIFDRGRPVAENLGLVAMEFANDPAVMEIVDFLRNHGRRPLAVPALDDMAVAGGEDGV
jgi:UDP-N-acetylglucosamine acyltransferase